MASERPPQSFGGVPRYQPGSGRPPTQSSATVSPSVSRAHAMGLGLNGGKAGLGLGKGKSFKRHKKIPRDTIRSITKGDIRRIARRGGVKRISAVIYDDVRQALKERLSRILYDVVAVLESSGRKTVTVRDVIFALNRLGNPIYGFDPAFIR
ncbi:histone-fold-containing protein [Lophiostoma macrostomum CBS 122681]|uniref:Histone H4 n=1 Tax=Lophiostoma macrostomum CBS 122681 TaxID=1314788 RepID=A0A6A6TGT0_9PLEO|nr:histone-fold-containing protein [Lophiostoma macrostomum CBS 122681]